MALETWNWLFYVFGHLEWFYYHSGIHKIEIPTEIFNLRLFTFSNATAAGNYAKVMMF